MSDDFDLDTARTKARKILLREINNLAPKVLMDLRKKVLPQSVELGFEAFGLFTDFDLLEIILSNQAEIYANALQGKIELPNINELTPFDRVFLHWANSYGLVDVWVIHTALWTLIDWRLNQTKDWNTSYLYLNKLEEQTDEPLDVLIPAFNPNTETISSFKQRLEEIEKQIRLFKKSQLKKKSQLEMHEPKSLKPFHYLIRLHILNDDWRTLGTDSQQGIRNAVNRLSNLIDFTQRKISLQKNIHEKISHKNLQIV